MNKKLIVNILLIILLAIVQLSFIRGLPGVLQNLNFALVVLIFISALGGIKTMLWSTICTGFLFDMYGFTPFGTNLAALTLAVLAAKFFGDNFFTDRSLYSFLVITLFASIIYRSLSYAVLLLFSFFNPAVFLPRFDWQLLGNEFFGLSMNLAGAIVVFYLVASFSSSLKPVFLSKRRFG